MMQAEDSPKSTHQHQEEKIHPRTPPPPPALLLRTPERRRSSTELLDIMAEFEVSQGFPLLERHWLLEYGSTTGAGGSDADNMMMRSAPSDESSSSSVTSNSDDNGKRHHSVLRSWSPLSGAKALNKGRSISPPSPVQQQD